MLDLCEVFSDEGHHPVDALSHLLDVLHHTSVRGGLVFPGLPGDVQLPSRLSAEQELKRCEAGGSLGYLSHPEEYIRQHQVPVATILCHHTP